MAKSKPIESTAQLAPDPANPRKISEEQKQRLLKSIEAYGDLSGVVFNRRTRLLVGGHQRSSLFGPECQIEAKYFDKPDKHGTVGMGYIILKDGSKHSYREVDWPKEKAMAANIAANAHGGEWEEQKLREMLTLVSETDTDAETLGLEDDFLENLFRNADLKLNVQEQEAKALTEPLTIEEIKNLPSQTAMIQLFLTMETRPEVIRVCRELQVAWGTSSITDTFVRSIKESHQGIKAKSPKEEAVKVQESKQSTEVPNVVGTIQLES
jgi:hypothetical protein